MTLSRKEKNEKPEKEARKDEDTAFATERSWLQKTSHNPNFGPDFVFISFKLAHIRHMPQPLQILVVQNVTENGWAILVALADGPESIRGIAEKLKYFKSNRSIRIFKYIKTSRRTVSQSIKELAKLGFIDGPRKGRGGNYRLSRRIIPFLFKGLREAWEIHVES